MRQEPRRNSKGGRRSATLRRSPWFALILVAACAGSARGDDVSLRVENVDGVYYVQGTFTAPVSAGMAWSVLTDYEHIGDYVKSVRKSRVERRSEGVIVLRQDARGGVFPLQKTIHVLLDVREEPEKIGFDDRLGQDFRLYRGEWVIKAVPSGTVTTYALEARPVIAMPHVLGRSWMGHEARELLAEVRAEMIRREHGALGEHERGGRPISHPAAGALEGP
ncbi:MAG TPA: SRPBCC family protein [Candidatus Udaeobacter sp.]|jgi:hypothetical protein|nr:SRPBCC family protein [Candidatus Udaeobacter sp.]